MIDRKHQNRTPGTTPGSPPAPAETGAAGNAGSGVDTQTIAPSPAPQAKETASKQAYVVLAVVTISSFFIPFMSAATNVALPQMARELDIAAPLLSWVNTSYMLAAAALLLPLGRLADLRGRRNMFVWGTFAFALVTGVTGHVTSQNSLLAMRLLQGATGAIPMAASMPLLISTWPPALRGRAIGINIAGVYTGLSIGPVLGGFLTQMAGWRSIFMLTAVLGVIVALMAATQLPSKKKQKSEGKQGHPAPGPAGHPGAADSFQWHRFDWLGSVLSAGAMIAIMIGLSRLPGRGGVALLATGIITLTLFAWWENRVASPLFDTRLFTGNKTFLFSNLAALINYCATAGVGFLLSLYLQRVQGLDPRQAGMVLVVQPILMALLSVPIGRLSDTIEPGRLATLGMSFTCAGLLMLTFIGPVTPIWFLLIALAILGVAFAFFSSPNTNAVMSSVEQHQLGVASATLGTMRSVGQMLSLGICGLLFSLIVGDVKAVHMPIDDFIYAVRLAFAIFAGLCFMGIFASSSRGKVHS